MCVLFLCIFGSDSVCGWVDLCVLGVIIVTKRGRNGEEINQNSKKKNHGKIMLKENNIKK